ncbi:MAG: hypothetical protein NW215_06230 [Hyphomicrobiales bacterium]|nr:hypothetical protein [Hyphomicrobiales bacterium]
MSISLYVTGLLLVLCGAAIIARALALASDADLAALTGDASRSHALLAACEQRFDHRIGFSLAIGGMAILLFAAAGVTFAALGGVALAALGGTLLFYATMREAVAHTEAERIKAATAARPEEAYDGPTVVVMPRLQAPGAAQ